MWSVYLPDGLSVPDAVNLYSADPAVEYAVPNGVYYVDEACPVPVVQAGAIVSTTGLLPRPMFTTYQYGTYALGSDAGPRYALDGSIAELEPLVGKKVSVTGVVVPGYENGKVEGGPTFLDVISVEAAPAAEPASLPPNLIASNARVVVEEGVAGWSNSGFADDSLDGTASETVSLSVSYGTLRKTGDEGRRAGSRSQSSTRRRL